MPFKQIKKIVLISTYPDIHAYGLRMISSILKLQGYEIKLLFLNAPFGELYSQKVLEETIELSRNSLFIGVSLMTNFFERAKQVTQALKTHSEIPIIWGGIHTAIKPHNCLEYADAICMGEGEETIRIFANAMAASKDFNNIPNIWFKKDGEIIKNEICPMVSNIKDLPFPDYEYNNHFVIDHGGLLRMNAKNMEQYMGYEYQTMVTRGCFYKCSYCANNFFENNFESKNARKLRYREIKDVINELRWIKENLQFIRIFKISDDLFFALPKDTIEKFCKLYKESSLMLPLNVAGVHPSVLKEDKLKLLIDAGMRYVRMGIQSGSQNIRILYSRNETNEKIMESVNIIHKYKKNLKSINYDFIVDNPWETAEDIKDSLRLLVKFPKPYSLNIFSLTLYPGTDLYEKASREGIIKNEDSQIYDKHYHDGVRDSYYNGLFKIIPTYSLPMWLFIFLIEKESTMLARNIYAVLLCAVNPALKIKRIYHLIKEGIFDLLQGNFKRINRFVFVPTKAVH